MPIIGHGDIAKSLTNLDRPDVLFFASGVSNSSENREAYFDKEVELLNVIRFKAHIVYFSSLCVYYSESAYADHKRAQEWRVKNVFKSYTIIRLGNITWGSNPHTIINYFKSCYQKGVQPELQDTHRHLITRQEFEYWIKSIRVGVNDIMNIPGEFVHVKEIWRRVQNGEY